MDDKQLDRIQKLTDMKEKIAKMGGVRPFADIEGFVNQALDEIVEEIKGQPKDQPADVISSQGERLPNPNLKPNTPVQPSPTNVSTPERR